VQYWWLLQEVMMKALVLIAHGSRREASNHEVARLAEEIGQDLKGEYPIVQAGFLELAQPSIPDAIALCVTLGATDVVIVPYFLCAGRHVHEDVPNEVDKARTVHTNISMKIAPHIGESPEMKNLIREAAAAGHPAD
jgi:sirohydrochlorin ferrochelatase